MGFFGNLDPEAYDRQYTDRQLVARMGRYFMPYRRTMLIIVGTLLLTAALDVAYPLIVSYAVNVVAEQAAPFILAMLVGAVFLSGVLSWVTNYVRRRLTTQAVGDVVLSLRADAFRATIDHDLSFYDQFSAGRIVSRITSDTQEFANVVVLVADTLSQLIVVGALTLALLNISWQLTVLLWLTTPAILFVALGFRRLARYVTRQGNRAMANVNASIQETISGIAVAKNFRQEQTIYDEFRAVNQSSYTINVRRGFVLAAVFPVLNMVAGVATGLLVYFGGLATGQGLISFGAWFLFTQSVERFFFPFINLASFWSQVQAGLSAAERVFGLIDAAPAVRQTAHDPVPPLRGEIEFDRVRFQYSDKEIVLPEFSLHIRPGETVALVGHTGAGKSSIAKLIARFYEFQGGHIRIDGRDIRALDLRAYRQQLGIVSQAPFLFAGTVADNIRYAQPDLTDAAMLALARQIGGGEWLDSLPNGLHTEVGQRGAKLSLGQRQLVALLRVLAQKPAIFILDEATASVDPFTESQIQQALDLILQNSTAIVIAHRLSTVRAADRILVLQKGRIIEQGTHTDLLRAGGHYAELYDTYFRHQSAEFIEAAGAYKQARLEAQT